MLHAIFLEGVPTNRLREPTGKAWIEDEGEKESFDLSCSAEPSGKWAATGNQSPRPPIALRIACEHGLQWRRQDLTPLFTG